ncbi:hypothetical protein ACK33Y_16280 [Aeromonas jandaei]
MSLNRDISRHLHNSNSIMNNVYKGFLLDILRWFKDRSIHSGSHFLFIVKYRVRLFLLSFFLFFVSMPAWSLDVSSMTLSNMSIAFNSSDSSNITDSRVCGNNSGNCSRYANKIRMEVSYDNGRTRVYEGYLPSGTSVPWEAACDLYLCPKLRAYAMNVLSNRRLSLTSSGASENGNITGIYAIVGFERRGVFNVLRGHAELTWYWRRSELSLPITSCSFSIGTANFGIIRIAPSYGQQVGVSISGSCNQTALVRANIGNALVSGSGAVFRVRTASGNNIGTVQCYASSRCSIDFSVVLESYQGMGGSIRLSAPVILLYD